ncbi:MAG: tetratricopeptide repeat protein [Elusimicrobiota bacterium]|nr:MAG: tetratricopeptide repeat protein [Elusimicrobiota bacterium]
MNALRLACAKSRRAAWEGGRPLRPSAADEKLAAKVRAAGRAPWALAWLAQHELRSGRPAACLEALVWAESGSWTSVWRAEARLALAEAGSPAAEPAAEARRLALAGRPAEAARRWSRALALSPGDAGLHERRAACWTLAGRHARAAADWSRAGRLSPGARAELGLAKALHSLGLYARAAEAAARAAALRPGDEEPQRLRDEALRKLAAPPAPRKTAPLSRGRRALIAGRPAQALRALDAALRLEPRSYQAVVWKARALRGLGRLDESLALWKRAARLRPEAQGPRVVAAELGGDPLREASARAGFALERALPGLADALGCDPRWTAHYDPDVLARFHRDGLEAAARFSTGAVRGRVLRLLGRLGPAAALLRAEKTPEALAWLGELELARGRRSGLALLESAAKARPGWAWPTLVRALAMRALGRKGWEDAARAAAAAGPRRAPALALRGVLDGSVEDLDEASRLDPACAAFPSLAGLLLLAAGRRDEALARAAAAMRINPETNDVYHEILRRECAWSSAPPKPWDWTLVQPQLEALLAREPGAAWALAWRAVAVGGTNTTAGLERAVADFTRAIELDPSQAWFWTYRGRMRIYRGDPGGLDDTRRALEMDGRSAWLWAWQGAVRLKLRDAAGARADLDRAVALDPYYDRSWWWRGMAEGQAGRFAQAVAEYSRGIDLLPSFALFHFDRAAARARLGDASGAAADLTAAADLDYKLVGRLALLKPADLARALAKAGPRDATAAGWRGQALVQAGDMAGALEALAACRRLSPAWFWARAWSAEAFLHAGRLEEAVAEAGAALRLRPGHPAAFSARGRALALLGRLEEAERDLDAAVTADVKAAGDFSWRGRVRLERGRPEQALPDLDWALSLDALEAAPTLLLRARARGARGRGRRARRRRGVAAAARTGRRMTGLSVAEAAARLREGADLLRRQGRTAEAVEVLTALLGLRPKDRWALASRGTLLQSLERREEAAADFRAALKLDPGAPDAETLRGRIAQIDGDYARAERHYARALAADPADVGAAASRGAVLRVLGRQEEALDMLSRTIAARPDDAWALALRGRTYRTLGRFKEALADFDASIALKPEEFSVYSSRAMVLHMLGDYERARKDMTKALSINPRDNGAYTWRGMAAWARGDAKAALLDFMRSVDADPKDSTAHMLGAKLFALSGRRAEAALHLAKAMDLTYGEERLAGPLCDVMIERAKFAPKKVVKEGSEDFTPNVRRHEETLADLFALRDKSPGDALVHAAIARVHLMFLRMKPGLESYGTALKLDPSLGWELRLRELNYDQEDGFLSELHEADKLVASEPKSALARCVRAKILESLGRLAEAERDLAAAARRPAAPLWAGTFRARLLERLGRPKEALAVLDGLLRREPRFWKLHALRGELLARRGARAKAAAAFDAAVAADPRRWEALAWRALADLRWGRPARALKSLDEALALSPRFGWALTWRAAALLDLGRGKEALADLSRAVALDPWDVEAWIWTARARRERGELKAAEEALHKAWKLTGIPDHLEAVAERALLWAAKGDAARARKERDKASRLSSPAHVRGPRWAAALSRRCRTWESPWLR